MACLFFILPKSLEPALLPLLSVKHSLPRVTLLPESEFCLCYLPFWGNCFRNSAIHPGRIASQTWRVSPWVLQGGLLQVLEHWYDVCIFREYGNALCGRSGFCIPFSRFEMAVCRLQNMVGLILYAIGIVRFSRWKFI